MSTTSSKKRLFKNAFTIQNQSMMRGDTIKALKEKVLANYQNVTIQQLDSLFPKKKKRCRKG